MDWRRDDLTLEFGGHCQTTADSCVGILVAASKEVAWEVCDSHSLGNQKGRMGQRKKSAVGAAEDLDTDRMPTVRDSLPTLLLLLPQQLDKNYFGKECPQNWSIFSSQGFL